MNNDNNNFPPATEPTAISGTLTNAGTMQVSGEELTGLFIQMPKDELRAVKHLPMYERVTVTSGVPPATEPAAPLAVRQEYWKPMETAPKDRLIDIWDGGCRIVGCYWDHICSEWRSSRPHGVLISFKHAEAWTENECKIVLPPAARPPAAPDTTLREALKKVSAIHWGEDDDSEAAYLLLDHVRNIARQALAAHATDATKAKGEEK